MEKKFKIRYFNAYTQLVELVGDPRITPSMQNMKQIERLKRDDWVSAVVKGRRGEVNEEKGLSSRLRATLFVKRMRDEPLEHTFIAEHELAQVLNHAGPLSSEIFNGLDDQIETRVLKTLNGGLGIVCALSLQHIKHAVDCAKGPGPPTACATVDQNRSLALRFGVLASKFRGTGGTDDFIALLNQIQQMGWLRGRSKVWPVGILKLGDIS